MAKRPAVDFREVPRGVPGASGRVPALAVAGEGSASSVGEICFEPPGGGSKTTVFGLALAKAGVKIPAVPAEQPPSGWEAP